MERYAEYFNRYFADPAAKMKEFQKNVNELKSMSTFSYELLMADEKDTMKVLTKSFPDESRNNRTQGNEFYAKKEFIQALVRYTLSIWFAESGSVEAALAYANRSACYLEMKEYQMCLENTERARVGYPEEKMKRLDDREKKCKKMMATDTPQEDPLNVQLSFPANEKIPFLVNCLDLCWREPFGRCIFTTENLKIGDIIAIEDPAFKVINVAAMPYKCANCLTSNKLSLFPSAEGLGKRMVCTEKCREEITKKTRNVDFCLEFQSNILLEALEICDGDATKLEKLMDDPEIKSKTIFDFDFSGDPHSKMYKYQQLICYIGLCGFASKTDFSKDPVLKLIKTEDEKRIALKFMNTQGKFNPIRYPRFKPRDDKEYGFDTLLFGLSIKFLNTHVKFNSIIEPPEDKVFGCGSSLFGFLINHSCDHNVSYFTADNKTVYYANRSIPKNEQLFISYSSTPEIPEYSIEGSNKENRELFRSHFTFVCTCAACKNDWKLECDCNGHCMGECIRKYEFVFDLNFKTLKMDNNEKINYLKSLEIDENDRPMKVAAMKILHKCLEIKYNWFQKDQAS